MNLHIEEPPRILDLGESDFGVRHLSLLTTSFDSGLAMTVFVLVL